MKGIVVEDTGVMLRDAVSQYIYEVGYAGMTPYLDGRVVLEGGVPGNSANDFIKQYP